MHSVANRQRKQSPGFAGFLAIILVAQAALAQPQTNRTGIVLQDLQVTPQVGTGPPSPLLWLTEIGVACAGCSEGEEASFLLNITSLADRPMTLNSLALVDASGIVFAGARVNKQLVPNQAIALSLRAALPPPTRGSTLYYTPCFSVTDSADGRVTESCEPAPRRLSMKAFSVEAMALSVYVLVALVLFAIAVSHIAISRKLDSFEAESPD